MSKSRLWAIKRLLGHLKSLRAGLESSLYFGWWEVAIISCHSTPLYSYKYKIKPLQLPAKMLFYWNTTYDVLQISVENEVPQPPLKWTFVRSGQKSNFHLMNVNATPGKHGPSSLVMLSNTTSTPRKKQWSEKLQLTSAPNLFTCQMLFFGVARCNRRQRCSFWSKPISKYKFVTYARARSRMNQTRQ